MHRESAVIALAGAVATAAMFVQHHIGGGFDFGSNACGRGRGHHGGGFNGGGHFGHDGRCGRLAGGGDDFHQVDRPCGIADGLHVNDHSGFCCDHFSGGGFYWGGLNRGHFGYGCGFG